MPAVTVLAPAVTPPVIAPIEFCIQLIGSKLISRIPKNASAFVGGTRKNIEGKKIVRIRKIDRIFFEKNDVRKKENIIILYISIDPFFYSIC